MTLLLQSSNAQNRSLGHWYTLIQSGQLKLQRFQRFQRMEAWDRGRVVGFLNTVIQSLSVGVTLLLKVIAKTQFVSRERASARQTRTCDRSPAGWPTGDRVMISR